MDATSGKRDGTVLVEQDTGKRFEIDPAAVINIFNLYKVYKRDKLEVLALRGLNMRVRRGEVLMIAGPSGCGKTSLLNLLGGLDKPTAGKIFVDGEDITDLNFDELTRFRRAKIGFVFQFMNLVRSLNAKENVELPLIALGVPAREREARVTELLDAVGLRERRLHRPSELSGGEQQRVAIATALANNPSIILADEPTGELDSENAAEVMQLFTRLLQQYPDKTFIIVTHDLSLKKYANRVVHMRDGLVAESVQLGPGGDAGNGGQAVDVGAGVHDVLPEIPHLADVKTCPGCRSADINVSMMRSIHVEKPHPLFQLRSIVLACNQCGHVGAVKVKVFNP